MMSNETLEKLISYGAKWVNKFNLSLDCPWCHKGQSHFTVNPYKGLFNCYKCGAKGDLYKLQDKIGIKLIQTKSLFETPTISINDLTTTIETPSLSFDQLSERVNIKHELSDKQIISLPSGSSWTERAKEYMVCQRKFSLKTCEEYDWYYCGVGRFAGRVILPIFDKGGPVFFQGRTIMGSRPKYLSIGSPKSQVLWGLAIRFNNSVVLCEGIFDAARLRQYGFSGIALLGKTISDEQLSLLKKAGVYQATLMLDSDANNTPTWVKINQQIACDRVCLPYGKDPADLDYTEAHKILTRSKEN
jgi:DNA primase